MRIPLLASLGLVALPCLAISPARAEPAAAAAHVTVVHGVLGLTVDVYVNGALTLEDFAPRTIAGPLALPAGSYDIVIVAANGDPASPAIQDTATLSGGTDVSLVAHLAADGAPTLTAFANDVRPAGLLQGRIAVRHAAAAPRVDVPVSLRLGGWLLPVLTLRGISNGEQRALALWPLPLSVRITPAGQSRTTVLGPANLRATVGALTAVYAIGSLADGTLELLVQQIPLRRHASR